MAETSIITEPGKQEIITTREFDAPRDLVFRAWTDPELIARWWGPASFTALVFRVDLREGGRYLFGMRLPDGRDFWSTGVYREMSRVNGSSSPTRLRTRKATSSRPLPTG